MCPWINDDRSFIFVPVFFPLVSVIFLFKTAKPDERGGRRPLITAHGRHTQAGLRVGVPGL